MNEFIPPLIESHWFDFLTWTTVVVLFLWLIRKLVRHSKIKPGLDAKLRRLIPLADAIGIIWIIFLLSSSLFNNQPGYRIGFTIMIFVFVLWLLRQAFLDIISGIILRFENSFGTGDNIDFGEGIGRIGQVGLRCLDITLDKGKQVSIPYSQLSTKSLVKPSSTGPVKTGIFELGVPKSAGIADLKSRLNWDIMVLPWSVAALVPSIEPLDELSGQFRFKITIHALELEHLAEIERALREKYPLPA